MDIEYEATYPNIDKEAIRKKLQEQQATLIKKEFLLKRAVFHLPKGNEIEGGWARVRDEGDKITMSIKIVSGTKIEDQKEVCLIIDNFTKGISLLESLGCTQKAIQESKRELWKIGDVEICIDEWPHLEPFLEIEGPTEEAVKKVSQQLELNYDKALFCAVATLYNKKYGVSEEVVNNQTPQLLFSEPNPFIK